MGAGLVQRGPAPSQQIPPPIERHKNLALPVTQFTGPDAPRSHIRLSQRAPIASKECPKMYLTSEIVKDTQAARRFRLVAPLAVLLALAALTLVPGIFGN